MILKPGARLWSPESSTAIVVVRPPTGDVAVTCGGATMVDSEQSAGGPPSGGTVLGKRYSDPGSGLEVLCTRGGSGPLAVDGRTMDMVGARALPASD
ncbi:hypothetical protein [Pseudonocardia sp. ICBG162]|uniref:hypothetical protein n=1 Tax=Pseudonocardia sp. ICBG162 TaxID=2846761 RepID=UPI001CF69C72|nr:hypothetical protein [Pseudonocardia sp. ICBG162]